jgi:hypothetical protein
MRSSRSMTIRERNIPTDKKRVYPKRLKMVKYLTDDEAEQPDQEEDTIERSIMNLLASTPLPTPVNSEEYKPAEEESLCLDTDGPSSHIDDRILYSGVVTMSILISTAAVVVLYVCSMGAYTYPLWT